MNARHWYLKQSTKKPSSTIVSRLAFLAKSACWAIAAFGVSCLITDSAWAVTIDDNISKLEQRFFQHPYPKETAQLRLERLEKTVFGEAREGPENERLSALLKAIPDLNSPQIATEEESETIKSPPDLKAASPAESFKHKNKASHPDEGADHIPLASKYPAVTAIEQKLLGRDYAQEPVGERLSRLETKVFGKLSQIEDLSERVDRLKQRTGVDIASQVPRGSDWADDDDDGQGITEQAPPVARYSNGEDGKSFSGRDLRRDFRSMGLPRQYQGVPPSGSGAYGTGGAGKSDSYASGRYGMGGQVREAHPGEIIPFAPPISSSNLPTPVAKSPASGMGLNQQVGQLENEIFSRTYTSDPLPDRLKRLESTVFPQDKPAIAKSLPDRVNRLLSVVPISATEEKRRVAQSNQRALRPDPNFDDMSMPNGLPPTNQRRGLGKIINSISNFFTGGFSGGYPLPPSSLITDPSTGMLYDRSTGNLIDPSSGMVVGRRPVPGYSSGIGGISSFGSGFAPFGSFGTGFGGMRFGLGGSQFGGMWP